MKRLLASLIIIASFGIAHAGDTTVSLDDIIMLSQRNVSDETILVLLQNRKIGFTPDADDIDRLLEAGVSEEVIRYLLQNTTSASPNTNVSTPRYIYAPVIYVDPYPTYYYRPYYAGTSLFFAYSAFPHTSYRHRYHVAAYYKQRHHSTPSHLTHNSYDGHVTYTGGHNGARVGHSISSVGHSGGSVGHSIGSVGHSGGSVGHSIGSVGHSGGSVGHSSGSGGHSSSSVGHSSGSGGHSSGSGGHSSNSVGHSSGSSGHSSSFGHSSSGHGRGH